MAKTCNVMAVDLGASGGKCFAGAFDGDAFSMKEVHRFAHESVSLHVRDRAGALTERTVWDDVLLYENIVRGLHAYRHRVGGALDAIGIDTWGADGLFVDADGAPLERMYAYRDHRLDRMIEEVKARMDPERLYAITGICYQPFNVSGQVRWFVMNRRELLRPGVRFLPVPSLFTWLLCGEQAVDSSWASVTQLMDARTRRWSGEVLAALEIPPDLLPRIVAPGETVGVLLDPIARATGLSAANLVAVGSHDTASAFAAAPIERPEDALIISSGTWSLVGKLIPAPITRPEAMAVSISNEGGIGNTRFLKNCMGSWLVQELRRVWRVRDQKEMAWPEMDKATAEAPPFAALVDPDDRAFYNPPDMESAIAGFCVRTGQRPPATRGSMLRTVYESLALKYRMVHEQLSRFTGSPARVIHIVGGGSKNLLLNQFAADACGLPVVAGPDEATAVGNIMVQAMGMGLIKDLADALPIIRRAFPIRDYAPRDRSAWDRAAERFGQIVQAGAERG